MKNPLRRALPAALLVVAGASALAQAPAAPTPGTAPAENAAPAEVVPPKPPTTPAPGQKTAEVPDRKKDLSPGTPAPEEPIGASEKAGVDALSEAEVDQALAAIKDRYVTPSILSDAELKRATLQGLLLRLGAGVRLQGGTAATAAEASPFKYETIDNRIGYVRLGDANQAHVVELDNAIKAASEQKLGALVLDLRATPAGTELESTAEVCRRFAPKGKVLFSLKRRDAKEQIFTSKEDPRYRGLLVVLVDKDTAGSGEIIAAVLRSQVGAMLIGQQTEGRAAEFADVPLGQRTLRVAIAEVTLPDKAPLFPGGVKPDLEVEVPHETTVAVLKQQLETGVASLINETERPRMNEAALVAGTNPELEAAIAAQRNRGERPKAPLRDAVLQRAVDFVTTVTIYEKGSRGKR
jgi:hypothetical protein